MSDPSFEIFLASYPPEIRELATLTRNLIMDVIPDALEMVDPPSKIIAYGLGRKYSQLICAIAPYPKYINLMFSDGAELPDPDRRLEGTGKRARHVKIRQASDLEGTSLVRLLAEALQKKKSMRTYDRH